MTRSHKAERNGSQRLTMRLGGALVVAGVVMVAPGLVGAAAAVGGSASASPTPTSSSPSPDVVVETSSSTAPPDQTNKSAASAPTTSTPATVESAGAKCDNAISKSGEYNGRLFNYWFNGPLSQGWVQLKTGVTLCEDSVKVGIATYTAPKKTFSTPQELVDSQVGTIDNDHRSVSLHADSPDCYHQVDLFFGAKVLKKIVEGGEVYGSRMVSRAGATPVSRNGSSPVPARQSWFNGGNSTCTTPTPTPTETSTPTSTPPPTPTDTPTSTPTKTPIDSQTPTPTPTTPTPTESNPSTLPNTGGSDGLRNIGLAGLLAVNLGIGLLWWGSRPVRRH